MPSSSSHSPFQRYGAVLLLLSIIWASCFLSLEEDYLVWQPGADLQNERHLTQYVAGRKTLIAKDHTRKDGSDDNNQNNNDLDGDDKRAIAMISFGKDAANSTLLERAVTSIRRRGEFSGKIVVVTDAPLERYRDEFDENVYVILAREEDMKFDYFESPKMPYKRFKTYILEYLDKVSELDDVEFVYYMDIDIMLGAKFSDLVNDLDENYGIESPLEDDESEGATSGPVSRLFFFKDPYPTKQFHINGGFMVMNRRTSQHCLDLWRSEIDVRPKAVMDQVALNSVVENYMNECQVIGMEIEEYITFPYGDAELKGIMVAPEEYEEGGVRPRFSYLIHVFNSVFAERMSDDLMEEFVAEVLQLSEEERSEHKFGNVKIDGSHEKWSDLDEE